MLIGLEKLGRDPPQVVLALASLLVAGLTCVLPGAIWLATWSELRANKLKWQIDGPPCQVVPEIPASLISRRRPLKSFQYVGTRFTHVRAMAYCTQHPDNPAWPVAKLEICQFNNPGAVSVTIDRETTTFAPPVGQRATITVEHGKASCVVGGWFNL